MRPSSTTCTHTFQSGWLGSEHWEGAGKTQMSQKVTPIKTLPIALWSKEETFPKRPKMKHLDVLNSIQRCDFKLCCNQLLSCCSTFQWYISHNKCLFKRLTFTDTVLQIECSLMNQDTWASCSPFIPRLAMYMTMNTPGLVKTEKKFHRKNHTCSNDTHIESLWCWLRWYLQHCPGPCKPLWMNIKCNFSCCCSCLDLQADVSRRGQAASFPRGNWSWNQPSGQWGQMSRVSQEQPAYSCLLEPET